MNDNLFITISGGYAAFFSGFSKGFLVVSVKETLDFINNRFIFIHTLKTAIFYYILSVWFNSSATKD